MTKHEVNQWLINNDIRPETLSPSEDDSLFGICDISGEQGNIYIVTGLNSNDDIVEIWVNEHLYVGHLGKLAGWL